jgi:hypothetical protein
VKELAMRVGGCSTPSRARNTGQNLNNGISVFLIHETGIPVLILKFQKQTFSSIGFDDRCNDVTKKQVIT